MYAPWQRCCQVLLSLLLLCCFSVASLLLLCCWLVRPPRFHVSFSLVSLFPPGSPSHTTHFFAAMKTLCVVLTEGNTRRLVSSVFLRGAKQSSERNVADAGRRRERERGRHATVRERVRVFMFGAVCERWEGLDSGVAKQTSTQLIMSCQKR